MSNSTTEGRRAPQSGKRPEMITRTGLIRDRGWSSKLIEMFASEPDEYRINPRYRSGPRMQLYSLARIERIEKRQRFRREFGLAADRKKAAAKAAAAKRASTEAWVQALPVPHLPERTEEELTALAVRAYNRRGPLDDREWGPADTNSDPKFLGRITVNYVRHELTGYETEMFHSCGRVGAAEARDHTRHESRTPRARQEATRIAWTQIPDSDRRVC